MRLFKLSALALALFVLAISAAVAQSPASTTVQQIRRTFDGVNRKVLEMAQDFPEDKYDFKLKPEMRTFGEVIVHIASGNVYAAKAGRGEKVNWDELDSKNYKTKADIVAMFEKSMADADATLKGVPDDAFGKSVQPWLAVLEHSAEHYGLLVGYYRANGLVPPASRPKK
jgi:DinB superfamily